MERVNETYIREAIGLANLNALRIALYQQTGLEELATMSVEIYRRENSPLELPVLAKQHHARVVELAVEYLMKGDVKKAPIPSFAQARRLMELFENESPNELSAHYAYEDLAFEDFSRQASWTHKPAEKALQNFEVIVVGAGFSAIVAAIQLQSLGINFRIIERQADFGGTWQLNDYPEARVDISSFIYQYKFVRNYPWKHYFAPREELKEYVNHVVKKYDLRRFATFNTTVTDARWNEETSTWQLRTKDAHGNAENIESQVVFAASGLFSTARLPDIKGIESYRGEMFHTTDWNHDYDYTGKRVALIGTGCTGSQLLRDLAGKAADVKVFQRTANWVMPVPNYRNQVPEQLRWLMDNMPYYVNWYCYSMHTAQMRQQPIQELDREWQAQGGVINEKNDKMRDQLARMVQKMVGDRNDLAEKLTPDFAPLSRRLVIDNEFFASLQRDNVELLTNGIREFTPTGIVSADGTEREFDLVVLAAGFQTERYLHPVDYVGRDGRRLNDLWGKDGARAYLTMTLPGYPNFFIFYGPNAAVRAGSFHSWVEIFSRYICNLLTEMIERKATTVELREDVYEDYNARLNDGMQDMLWEHENGGGGSYYINEHGRSTNTMPWRMEQFYGWTRKPDFEEFIFK